MNSIKKLLVLSLGLNSLNCQDVVVNGNSPFYPIYSPPIATQPQDQSQQASFSSNMTREELSKFVK